MDWERVSAEARRRIGRMSAEEPNSGCWLWLGADNGVGYGKMSFMGRSSYAHRVSYMVHKGEIPEGKHIDHLCRVPCCVNPEHLEPVSNRENTVRGKVSALHSVSEFCPHGHSRADHGFYNKQGQLQCAKCQVRRTREWRRRNRGKMA